MRVSRVAGPMQAVQCARTLNNTPCSTVLAHRQAAAVVAQTHGAPNLEATSIHLEVLYSRC